jgi:hypothetical protein
MVPSTSSPERLSSVQDYKTFLDKFDTFLLDCDGESRIRFDPPVQLFLCLPL